MDLLDFGLMAAVAVVVLLLLGFGFLAGVMYSFSRRTVTSFFEKIAEAKKGDSEREQLWLQELFCNPSSCVYHKKGCVHIGSLAKAVRPCKHCLPEISSSKGS